ncbi:MAG: hypothetical protein UU48_C0002G0119 [Candidatus Uhrbacteria bacterium GW2011_GWF2_41_16]|uniref:Uncharacterized protein n=2 Tax=Candidatus Uhriibacteriota TaxID=1752732 RepID=A0A0G0VCI6_9BACT|nr:MAG: hypothetical protein UU31_C0003G0128 [Candidatus Uhrbacteria bacterium GW2011_GWA2_41_10]KKR87604.1 MAG: hypothetical protein UU35_C0002G0105 [Candidatus Uhrbacteria bacterium GW2011_GWC2_41_11]KKR98584.1 MAG: hypothetical protein UU48_C0002G0119 [Candidatus Uhrbacteria bacterium GW2011_GWF2_41_16]HBO99796.1 hypothetical protein [Candidatus Uhrbacteria bacterium]
MKLEIFEHLSNGYTVIRIPWFPNNTSDILREIMCSRNRFQLLSPRQAENFQLPLDSKVAARDKTAVAILPNRKNRDGTYDVRVVSVGRSYIWRFCPDEDWPTKPLILVRNNHYSLPPEPEGPPAYDGRIRVQCSVDYAVPWAVTLKAAGIKIVNPTLNNFYPEQVEEKHEIVVVLTPRFDKYMKRIDQIILKQYDRYRMRPIVLRELITLMGCLSQSSLEPTNLLAVGSSIRCLEWDRRPTKIMIPYVWQRKGEEPALFIKNAHASWEGYQLGFVPLGQNPRGDLEWALCP